MVGHALSGWFHMVFAGDQATRFKLKPYIKPKDPSERVRALEEAVFELQKQNKAAEDRIAYAEHLKTIETEKAQAEQKRAEEMASKSHVWEEIATENESRLEEYRTKMDATNIRYLRLPLNGDSGL